MQAGWTDDGTTVVQCVLTELLPMRLAVEHARMEGSAAEALARAAWEAAGLPGAAEVGGSQLQIVGGTAVNIYYWATRGKYIGRGW